MNACKMQPMTTNDTNKLHDISARRIGQLLYEKGWNKSELARKLGISVQAVQQWASGKSRPSGGNLTKLAEISGKEEFWFFQKDESPPPADELRPGMFQSTYGELGEFVGPLRDDHLSLLKVYEALPPAERRNMIAAFEMRLMELNQFYEKYIKNMSLNDKE